MIVRVKSLRGLLDLPKPPKPEPKILILLSLKIDNKPKTTLFYARDWAYNVQGGEFYKLIKTSLYFFPINRWLFDRKNCLNSG